MFSEYDRDELDDVVLRSEGNPHNDVWKVYLFRAVREAKTTVRSMFKPRRIRNPTCGCGAFAVVRDFLFEAAVMDGDGGTLLLRDPPLNSKGERESHRA